MSKKIIIPTSNYKDIEQGVQHWIFKTFGQNPVYDEALQSSIDQWGLPWFRAGVVAINPQGLIVMTHEARVQVRKIKDPELKQHYLDKGMHEKDWVDGDGGWNLPSGRLQPWEIFEEAALREFKEETGSAISPHSLVLLDIRYSDKPNNLYAMPIYQGYIDQEPPVGYQTKEISEVRMFRPDEIFGLNLRSPEFVEQALKSYWKRNLKEQRALNTYFANHTSNN